MLNRIGWTSSPFLKFGRLFVTKGLLSILDQGLFSGSNFVLTILLARWLGEQDYGAFSVAMAVFFLASGQYTSLILEPMGVFGPKNFEENHKFYTRFLLTYHLILSLIITLVVLIISIFIKNQAVDTVRVMALLLPLTLIYWLSRWFYYMQVKPGRALILSFFYATILFTGMMILRELSVVSSKNVFIVTGIASLIPSLSMFRNLGKIDEEETVEPGRFRRIVGLALKESWHYGKWIGLASLMQWSTTQLNTIYAAYFLNLQNVAGIRSIQNLAQPLEQVSTALGLLLIPWASRIYGDNSKRNYFERISLISWVLGIAGISYFFVIWYGKAAVFQFLYEGKYIEYAWILPFLIGVPFVMSLSRGAQIGIRAMRNTKLLLLAYTVSGLVSILVNPFLIYFYGLLGAVVGILLAPTCFSIIMNLLFLRNRKSSYERKL